MSQFGKQFFFYHNVSDLTQHSLNSQYMHTVIYRVNELSLSFFCLFIIISLQNTTLL